MDWEPLIAAARRVRERAYAPYSRYLVGAALATADGSIFAGANVENGLPTLAVCAERAAVAAAVAAGRQDFTAIAVVTESTPPARPCGLCRQTLVEFTDELPILCVNLAGERQEVRLSQLLPQPFVLARAQQKKP